MCDVSKVRSASLSGSYSSAQRRFGVGLARGLLVLTIAGCGMVQEMKSLRADAQRAQSAIQGEMHVPVQIGFGTSRTMTGSSVTVTVRLASVPSGNALDIRERIEKIVHEQFHTKVT